MIRRLDESLAQRVSGVLQVTSFASVVDALALNALDAGATSIVVTLDVPQFVVTVRDDGTGIASHELARVGDRGCTSKMGANNSTFGFRGEALHAIGLVSTLEITSRTERDAAPHLTVLRGGRRLMTAVASGMRARGTTVVVRDLFWNRPVQRKVLARPGAAAIACEAVRADLGKLAIAHAHVAFSLRDASSGRVLLETCAHGNALETFRQLCPSVPAGAFACVGTGLAARDVPPLEVRGWATATATGGRSAETQLLCVNGRPLTRKDELHRFAADTIIRLAAVTPLDHVDDGAMPDVGRAVSTLADPDGSRCLHAAFLLFVTASPEHVALLHDGEGLVAHFARDLNVAAHLREALRAAFASASPAAARAGDHIARAAGPPAATAAQVPRLHAAAEHRARPRACSRAVGGTGQPTRVRAHPVVPRVAALGLQSPSSRRLIMPPHADRPRESAAPAAARPGRSDRGGHRPVRVGLLRSTLGSSSSDDESQADAPITPEPTWSEWRGAPPRGAQELNIRGYSVDDELARGELARTPGRDLTQSPAGVPHSPAAPPRAPLVERPRVAARPSPGLTGAKRARSWLDEQRDRASANPSFEAHRERPGDDAASDVARAHAPEWTLRPALESVVALAAEPTAQPDRRKRRTLDSAPELKAVLADASALRGGEQNSMFDSLPVGMAEADRSRARAPEPPTPAQPLHAGTSDPSDGTMTITKRMLYEARLVGQVDRKWLAVRIGPTLALIDQHAADERVQLEALLELHVQPDGAPAHIETVRLDPPERMRPSAHEVALLRHHTREVHSWGWQVRMSGAAAPEVWMVQAPVVCSHTLRSRALLEYVTLLDEMGGGAQAPPRAVLRAVISKACRSAIMFGTALTRQQCLDLLTALGATKFPFQCAHGRPTIVPVADLSSSASASVARTTAASRDAPGAPLHPSRRLVCSPPQG